MVELVSSKKIDPEDFMDSKIANARKLEILNGKLDELNLQKIDIEDLLDKGLNNLLKLEYAYSIGDTDKKREIVGVVFPDKMEIENGVLRTGRVNEVIKRIYLMDSELPSKKKGQIKNKFDLSCVVGMAGRLILSANNYISIS
jgi:site-specific DNA recombinase